MKEIICWQTSSGKIYTDRDKAEQEEKEILLFEEIEKKMYWEQAESAELRDSIIKDPMFWMRIISEVLSDRDRDELAAFLKNR